MTFEAILAGLREMESFYSGPLFAETISELERLTAKLQEKEAELEAARSETQQYSLAVAMLHNPMDCGDHCRNSCKHCAVTELLLKPKEPR